MCSKIYNLHVSDEIRQDIEDAVSRLCPWKSEDGNAFWGGWARMAQPILNFGVVEVAKPNIGKLQTVCALQVGH